MSRFLKIHYGIIISFLILFFILSFVRFGHARDGDNHGNVGDLKPWFDQLASQKGLCCSFADGITVKGVDWDTGGPNNGYRVRLDGQWVNVPESALIKEPNRFGDAVVWPYRDADGTTQIRCFMPGAGT